MTARSASQSSLPVAWPLATSLLLTAGVVAFVCVPPLHSLRSWGQIFTLATLYLLVAGAVHALAVWNVCRIRSDDQPTGWTAILSVIWAAWVAIVWLPLIALLTAERSPWVAVVLPVTVIFATLLLKWRTAHADVEPFEYLEVARELFFIDQPPPLWRVLLPAVFTSVAAQIGVVLIGADHAWIAGCLFSAATLYPLERWLAYPVFGLIRERSWAATSAGNSIAVWLLLVLALVPFMAAYAAGELNSLLGMHARAVPLFAPPSKTASKSSGYSGIILLQPRKPRELVVPTEMTMATSLTKPRVIAFDGAYWYFRQPDTQPEHNARITRGTPVKNRIFSTDERSLVMEAHQPLGKPMALSCCRSLRIDVTNADNVPGTIAVEVLLRDTASKKTTAISLGTVVLRSSKVSPMPLNRQPVEDAATFQIPHLARSKVFNEVTVRIKPERSRSRAGAQVAIQDFAFQP